MEKINFDCRHFRGDVPCAPHKREGVRCTGCPYYNPVVERILIIKLDAAGDVLRTTCILPGLREKYPHARITWITKPESIPLFEGNGYIDRAYEVKEAAFVIGTDEFDLVINLDAAPMSSMLAVIAKGNEKIGFGYDAKGFVYPLSPEAEEWFLMGIFDDIKKANERTYQSIMLRICGLNPSDYSIQYALNHEEMDFAGRFAAKHSIKSNNLVIGLNTGGGRRWEKKKWTEDGYVELVRLLKSRYREVKILLYGGSEEIERNRRIISKTGSSVIDTGCDNSIRSFAALLNLSNVIVTGDTLALHLAVALRKKVVALIGPTSTVELDLYGRGIKVTAALPCLCCYRQKCDKNPDCMSSIRSEQVFDAIKQLIGN